MMVCKVVLCMNRFWGKRVRMVTERPVPGHMDSRGPFGVKPAPHQADFWPSEAVGASGRVGCPSIVPAASGIFDHRG